MKRLLGPLVIVLSVVTLVAAAAWSVVVDRATPATVQIAGRVYAEECEVFVPLLRSDAPTTAATPGQPTVAGLLTEMHVIVGDHVRAGDIIATLDTTSLDDALSFAYASAAEASATVALLGEKADDATDGRDDLDTKRREVRVTLADLNGMRADVAANLADARELARSLPTTPSVPATMPPGQVPSDPGAIIAQLEASLAKLDAGIAQVEAGLAKLENARATISDAIVVLGDAQRAASYAADAAQAGVALAQARLKIATVRTPVDGIVTQAATVGTAVYAGAPFIRIRPDGNAIVEAYVAELDAALLAEGTHVCVGADYLSSTLSGTVIRLAESYEYPPTAQATRDIHMVRAVRVYIRIDSSVGLPPGAPVDIIVNTGR
ncbi:MAG: HlyD family efflux transporter periplasmic adaptor subunit [Coriobacteriia bacterium]|nr:HlyD family efflux transporter periplasmic adaptor subunit [Coriobacteriia bacterium]